MIFLGLAWNVIFVDFKHKPHKFTLDNCSRGFFAFQADSVLFLRNFSTKAQKSKQMKMYVKLISAL